MPTFTFVELCNDDYENPAEYRMVILRGGDCALARAKKLDEFRLVRALTITSIYQIDAPDLATALRWVSDLTPVYRNGRTF